MSSLKRAMAAAAAGAVLFAGASQALASAEIMVMAQSLRGSIPEIIAFADHEPIQVNNATLVPVRDLTEAAGMSVEWDKPSQTAVITLNADAYSSEPAQRYAADVMSKVGGYGLELTAQNISASLRLNDNNAVLKYNFADSDGDIISIGKTVEMDSEAILVDGGSLMVPVRDTMELFGFEVVWNQSAMAVKISIPDYIRTPSGLGIIADDVNNEAPASYDEADYNDYSYEDTSYEESSYDSYSYEEPQADENKGTYIGTFKITHYCPCSICNGGYGSYTAWAGMINPGVTIAVNPNIIAPLSWVYVEGYGLRRAEDTGSGIGEYHIDMAVPNHAMAMSLGVVYKDVYLVSE